MIEAIYKTVPFVSLGLVLFGWALIELLRTRVKERDIITWTIVFAGLAGSMYILSLGLNYSPLSNRWRPDWWFDAIRLSLWVTVPGIPVIYINVWRAWRDRRSGTFRDKEKS